MNDTYVTITGNVVDNPVLRRTKNGHPVANFRVASTPRRFDREKNEWVDNDTLYVQVTAWRNLADNVGRSVFRGQPVVVYGRYCQHDYRVEEQVRSAYDLEAIAVGHDLSRGTTQFVKTVRVSNSVETDEEGLPSDATGHYLDLEERDGGAGGEVDLTTGEVREMAPV